MFTLVKVVLYPEFGLMFLGFGFFIWGLDFLFGFWDWHVAPGVNIALVFLLAL